MNALQALQSAGGVLLNTHSEPFSLFTLAGVTSFTAIRRTRYRNISETGGLVVELSLICRADAFGGVRPLAGHEVGASSDRWRIALIQPAELYGWVEIILEGEQP